MPEYEDLFLSGECDGPCNSCGSAVNMDQQNKHLAWHQELFTATGV